MASHGAVLAPTLATYDAMRRRGEGLGLAPVSRAKNTEVLDAGAARRAAGARGRLRSATSANADLLGRADLGRVAPGAAGDLVLLEGNPFDDPSVLWAPRAPWCRRVAP